MFLKILSSVLASIVAFPVAVAAAPREHSMTLCDLVKQINDLNGRIVSVRGTITMSDTDPDNAVPDYLVGTCPDLKVGMVMVRIDYPDVWFLKKPPKGFHMDERSFIRAHKVVMGTLKDGMVNGRFVGTIAGQAYAPPPSSVPPPGIHRAREGSYDAVIIIQGIYDLKVVDK